MTQAVRKGLVVGEVFRFGGTENVSRWVKIQFNSMSIQCIIFALFRLPNLHRTAEHFHANEQVSRREGDTLSESDPQCSRAQLQLQLQLHI